MSTSKEEVIKGYKIEYQVYLKNNLCKGRFIIRGSNCSTATTKSSFKDLSLNEFHSIDDAYKKMHDDAVKKIDNAKFYHTFEFGNSKKCTSCDCEFP